MKKLVKIILIVTFLVSIVMWIDFNQDSIAMLPTLGFSIPSEVFLLWGGICIALGCIVFLSIIHNDEEDDEEDDEDDEYNEDDEVDAVDYRLERALRIRREFQEQRARGEKRHLQIITFPVNDTKKEK